MRPQHNIRVVIDELEIRDWQRYEISCDMLELADRFTLELPLTRELWDACPTDAPVQVFIDQVQVVDGFIDDREAGGGRGGDSLTLLGRDKGGRLIDESMPLGSLRGIGIQELAERVAGIGSDWPWFERVVLSNARNRQLLRGRGYKAKAGGEPPIVSDPNAAKRVQAGDTRADTILHFLEEIGLLLWSSADGRELIAGKPNYDQDLQYRFFYAGRGSARTDEVNVLTRRYRESVADRYSEITVLGTGRGDGENYGENVARRAWTVSDGPRAYGVGEAFTAPKRLLVGDDDIRNIAQAKVRAEREAAQRLAAGRELELECPNHGLFVIPNAPITHYAFDTMAHWEDETTGEAGDYLVTACSYSGDRSRETTMLRMVPKGTELTQ